MGRSQCWGAQKPGGVGRPAQASRAWPDPVGLSPRRLSTGQGASSGADAGGLLLSFTFFSPLFVPQENGSSSQQMDDLFDILIQSGGKARTPEPPP